MSPWFKNMLILVLCAIPPRIMAQNRFTNEGLKIGHWVDTISGYSGARQIETGIYTVIPKNKYVLNTSVFKNSGRGVSSTRYLNAHAILQYDNFSGDSLSVKDGAWKSYDSAGRLKWIRNWNEGIWKDVKEFDSSGNILSRYLPDYENNNALEYSYENSRLFKKTFYPSLEEGTSQETYYPGDNLAISDAAPEMNCRFSMPTYDTTQVVLSARHHNTTVTQINFPANFAVLDKDLNDIMPPFKISRTEERLLYVIYKPTPATVKQQETITVKTNGRSNSEYCIYVNTYAAHFDWLSIQTTKNFSVSKSLDKYLILPDLSGATSISIFDPNGIKTEIDEKELPKVDLVSFSTGKYRILYASCDFSEILEMNIVE